VTAQPATSSFSALQRAENSSIHTHTDTCPARDTAVSVLFSEPKIPQLPLRRQMNRAHSDVSVLFSEPKIPQSIPYCVLRYPLDVSVLFSEPKIPQ